MDLSPHIIVADPELRDDLWLNRGGEYQNRFRAVEISEILLDLSQLTWADPTPLLSLACLCAEFRARGGKLAIELGKRSRTAFQFLIFFAQHGFLSAIAKDTPVRWEGRIFGPEEHSELENILRTLPGALAYQDAECIPARIYSVEELAYPSLGALIEDLVELAHPRISSWLTGNSRRRGLMLHRLRVFLGETLDNVADHAYRNGNGFGALYARIRAGLPEESTARAAWIGAKEREAIHCPALGKCRAGKRPGWLEFVVCDMGVGLTYDFSSEARAPLQRLSLRLFLQPLSRIADRALAGKTDMTGLQRIGHMLRAGDDQNGRGDYVRLYSQGEWVGEHLPWSKRRVPGRANVRINPTASPPAGTVIHFAVEPPPAEVSEQVRLYPDSFAVPKRENLVSVRKELTRVRSLAYQNAVSFYDFYRPVTTFARDPAELRLLGAIEKPTIIVRPSRGERKIDLVNQVRAILNSADARHLVFVDMPWSLAIDFHNIIANEKRWPGLTQDFKVYILSQDWCCSCLVYSPQKCIFETSKTEALAFLRAPATERSAAQAAAVLRRQDSILFWAAAKQAYLNEPVKWQGSEASSAGHIVHGYLDLSFALALPSTYGIARRAVRRAVSSFAPEAVYAVDDIVSRLLTADFSLTSEAYAVPHDGPTNSVLVGSVLGSGSTVRRFLRGDFKRYLGAVQLLRHSGFGVEERERRLLALDWVPPKPAPAPAHGGRQLFERVANTPLVIRGGERAVPLPHFRRPVKGRGQRESLFGEDPNVAYQRWQRLGLLRLGHWTYGMNHDLLTLRMNDALTYDAVEGGAIAHWAATQIDSWLTSRGEKRRGFVVYAQHEVNERLVRAIKRHALCRDIQFFPAASLSNRRHAALLLSPMTREAIIDYCSKVMESGGAVVILDDAIITGVTIRGIRQAIEGLWETLRDVKRVGAKAQLRINTLALVDRSGEPAQRVLVERDQIKDRRYWRWDVPALGHRGTCPLCALHARWKAMDTAIHGGLLKQRLRQWLDQWDVTPVEEGRFDAGVPARRLEGEHATRFGVERGVDAHEVHHFLSVSRVSITAEIARSTTRKDYPLHKARQSLTMPEEIDCQTGLEILASQLLLFPDDLSIADRADRLMLLLDLVWQMPQATISTALAGLVTLIDHSLIAELWLHCVTLIEARAFPHEDALLIALVLFHSVDRREKPPFGKSPAWEVFDLCRRASTEGRQALAMVLRVFGWSTISIHSSALPDGLLKSTSDTELSQTLLMLERLAEALHDIPVAAVEKSTLKTRHDSRDIKNIVKAAEALRAESRGDIGERPGRQEEIDRDLRLLLHEAWTVLFGKDGLQPAYMGELTTPLRGADASREILTIPWQRVLDAWPNLLKEKGLEGCARWPRVPEARFEASNGHAKGENLYFDSAIKRALADLMSNVAHSDRPIPCPWPEGSLIPDADLWGRITVSDDGLNAEIELVNGYDGEEPVRPRITSSTVHLDMLGGKVEVEPNKERRLFITRIALPTAAGLTRS